MEPSSWEFRSLCASKLEDDKIWPVLGSDNSNHLQPCSSAHQDSNSKDDNYINANLNYIDYPKLGEKMNKMKTSDNIHQCVLDLRSNCLRVNRKVGDPIKYKSLINHKRTDRMYINLQEIIENAITNAKVQNLAKSNMRIHGPLTSSRIIKTGKKSKYDSPSIRKERLSNSDTLIVINKQKTQIKHNFLNVRHCLTSDRIKTMSEDADNIDVNASCHNNTNYMKRLLVLTPNENSPNDFKIVQPDLISTINNIDISQMEKREYSPNNFDTPQDGIENDVIERTRSLRINDNEVEMSDSTLNAKVQFSKNFRE